MKREMKIQRIGALVNKELVKIIREPAQLFLIILFPLILTLAFGVSFGGTQSVSYQIGVVNLNSGAVFSQWADFLIGNLTSVRILKVRLYEANETAQADLIEGKIQGVLIIPKNFGQSCVSYWVSAHQSLWVKTDLQLYLDSGSMFATQAIPPIVQQALVWTVLGANTTFISLPVTIANPSTVASKNFTTFDFMAPGIFTFAMTFLIMTISQSFTSERQQGLLRRINTTPTSSTELMLGQAISNMLTAVLQGVLLLAMAFALGFHPAADLPGLILAFVILMIFSLCCVGFGLITAAISKSPEVATGVAFVFIIPLMFLGTYVTDILPQTAKAFSILVPSYHATEVLTSLLLRGAPILSQTVLSSGAILVTYSLLIFIVGIALFNRFGWS